MTTQDDPVFGARMSLRHRWNRAFLALISVVALAGLVSLTTAHLLVDSLRGPAERLERDGTANADLRKKIVDFVVVAAGDVSDVQIARVQAAERAIRSDFAEAIAEQRDAGAAVELRSALGVWEALSAALGAPGTSQPVAVRGAAVATRGPVVLELLDKAAASNREAIREDLVGTARLERIALGVIALLELLAIALAVRLARRLFSQVLGPVAALQDSADHLAAGELDHRVHVHRVDELGQLGISFNHMAESIAGSQRILTVEAMTDSLSGLANRAAFRARLEEVFAPPSVGGQAVLFVDLDDFKDVNDTLGHAAGDELLQIVAARLTEAVRPGDLVARLGGDEFAVLLDGLTDPRRALEVAQGIVAAVGTPVCLGTIWKHVGASVGLAMRKDDSTVDKLVREADVAMYAAKAKGKNRVESYDAGLDEAAVSRQMLRAEVAVAAEKGQLVVDYQPVIDLTSGAVVGVEALVRWSHPTRGLLPPLTFIDLAEEGGAIVGIGQWVMGAAMRQLRSWQLHFDLPALWMSVNVSVRQLEMPEFAFEVKELLRSVGLDPSTLVIEVTESVLADPNGGAAAALSALRVPGVRVALDDFGTGYSSIGYLRQLPVDVLKIDRSFVSGGTADEPNTALLEAIVAMAQHLGLDVIPEGIEEPEQLERLRRMGCTIGQGFLLHRPASAEAIGALLALAQPCAAMVPSAEWIESVTSGV